VPGAKIKVLIAFKRPGIASSFIPNAGTDQECKTSEDVIRNLIGVLIGNLIKLSTSNKR